MAEKRSLSMVAQLEEGITKLFYSPDAAQLRRECYAVGLQTPLWLWTHEEESSAFGHARHTAAPSQQRTLRESKDVRKTCHLMEWLLHNQVDLSTVAVIAPVSLKECLRTELLEALTRWMVEQQGAEAASAATPLPVVLAHHELTAMNRRDSSQYTFDVVVYILGLPPEEAALPLAVSQGDFIGEALNATRRSFVMIADSGWTGSHCTSKWSQWRVFLSKLQEEQAPLSTTTIAPAPGDGNEPPPTFPSLVGSSLPLCCARHPNHRQLAYGLTTIPSECKRLCLCRYDCGVEVHLCRDTCHPNKRHGCCPFACGRTLPCGHECLLTCSSRCNCFEVVERPLPCSHQVVLGLDKETLEPIYGTVQHIFKGVCADAELPCAVEFSTECARCLGSLTVKCFEAQEHGHTSQNRTLLCDACKRTERELRAQILGEVLFGAEAEKKKLKVELQRALHQQRKAAAQGLFTPGVKVEIVDATKCVPPLLADEDFPGVAFVDMDDGDWYASMEGVYGTFISSHVDVMDRSELRNLVRLPDGKHVLVTDGGLRMIRALTTGVTGNAAGATLLLTAKATNHSDAHTCGEETAGGGNAPEFDKAKTMVGATYYLSEPVACGQCEGGMVSDKVVTVTAIDPSSAADVVVECRVLRHKAAKDATDEKSGESRATEENSSGLGSEVQRQMPEAKRARLEAVDGEAAGRSQRTQEDASDGVEVAVLSFTAPITALEPVKGYEKGQYVYVTNPKRQITDPHVMADLATAIHKLLPTPHTGTAVSATAKLSAAPVNSNTAYELLGIVNPPLWMGAEASESAEDVTGDAAEAAGLRLGPCAILRPRGTAPVVAANNPKRGRRAAGGRPVASPATVRVLPATGGAPLSERPLVAVPFMFTAPDELTEAENALDAAAQLRFEERLREAITVRSEELSLRNDEDAFHVQQQMGEVTTARRKEVRTTFSVPVALPTAEHVAAVRRHRLQLPIATPVTARIAKAKDALAAKAEAKETTAWVEAMRRRFTQDAESATLHIRSVQAFQQPQLKHNRHSPQPHAVFRRRS